jgi:hypothetical protein
MVKFLFQYMTMPAGVPGGLPEHLIQVQVVGDPNHPIQVMNMAQPGGVYSST